MFITQLFSALENIQLAYCQLKKSNFDRLMISQLIPHDSEVFCVTAFTISFFGEQRKRWMTIVLTISLHTSVVSRD